MRAVSSSASDEKARPNFAEFKRERSPFEARAWLRRRLLKGVAESSRSSTTRVAEVTVCGLGLNVATDKR